MKVLVYGARGWIGQQFTDILKAKSINFVSGEARVDNDAVLRQEIELHRPSHVISFIGRTHGRICDRVYSTIDYLEQPGKLLENVRDNLFGPLMLAEICRQNKIHFTYLGTGCIFKFDEQHPFGEEKNGFREDSLPNFFGSSYSIVKGFTDRLMQNLYADSALNLRIRMPISGDCNGRNFITKITNYERICSVPNSMTVLPELLPIALDMMAKEQTGTINLTNPGLISHNRILEMYREIVDPNFTWKNFSVEEQRSILAADRSNNFLDTSKLKLLYPQVKPIEEAVRQILYEYKQSLLCLQQKLSSTVNLLITGGCGFIGSNFINYYFKKGKFARMINVDAMHYCANEANVDETIRGDSRYIFIRGNVSNAELMAEVLSNHNISHVIHFAAQSHVQNSFSDSLQYTYDNICGTHVLLEACREYGRIQRFIHVSTDEVYGESMNKVDETRKAEHSVLCPTNPYAATKAGAELIAQSYFHSFKMPIIITRSNNIYGPNQYKEKLIPLFIDLLRQNKKLTIHGAGTAVRGFVHVYDVVRAFECVFEKGSIGEIYNIGCEDDMEYSVLDVAAMLVKMMKGTDDVEQWIEHIEDRPFNDQRYYITYQKIKDLGWNIRIKFEDGLADLLNPGILSL